MKEAMGELTFRFPSGEHTADYGCREECPDAIDWGKGELNILVKVGRASVKVFDD